MTILKFILISLGLVFLTLGYKIYFGKDYKIINGFERDYKAGIKTESYAKKVGLIEFIIGIILLIMGIYLLIAK